MNAPSARSENRKNRNEKQKALFKIRSLKKQRFLDREPSRLEILILA